MFIKQNRQRTIRYHQDINDVLGTINDYTLIDLEIFQQENVPPPIIHVAIMSVRSYNRYHETIVMIKSLLFHRKTR